MVFCQGFPSLRGFIWLPSRCCFSLDPYRILTRLDDLKPLGEEQWEKNPGKRGGPAGQKSGAQCKTELVGERKLQPYAPHGMERTN